MGRRRETSSAFFFRLIKKWGVNRQISALKTEDGAIVSDTAGLCDVITSFYSDLFRSQCTDDHSRSALLSNVSCTLSPVDAEDCEGLLSVAECHAALVGMARHKAPGSDKLPMEFYVKFWDLLGEDLVCVLNSCLRSGRLSLSQHRGIISLSFKKGDRLDIRNWRPISLLNVDYKLAARAIAGRLLKVIHIVVAKDQTCGVPGRFIGENVAFLRDVVDFATWSNSPVVLLSLNQEKAFDRVEWSFMGDTLLAMGFGPSFISWVDLVMSKVLLTSMAIFPPSFRSPGVFVKAVPSRLFCMFWLRKFWPVAFVQTPESLVFCCRGLCRPCQLFPSMLTTHPW